jgi:two-component system sensor histidine kinase KdpD
MEAHGIADAWETRERVVVAVTGAPGGSQLVRRAARIAGRMHGGLIGVHVVQPDGLRNDAGAALIRQHRLVEALGGSYREIVGERVQEALVDFARSEKATQVVVGASRRGRWYEIAHGSVVNAIVREAEGFDVHVIAQRDAADDRTAPRTAPSAADEGAASEPDRSAPRVRRRRPPRRRIAAWLLVVAGLPLLTLVLAALREQLSLATDLLLFLAVAVGAALLGGFAVGLVAAVASSLLVNWYFTPPIHTWTIADPENLIAVIIFVAGAIGASALVDRVTTRSREALRARAEAAALARTSAILIGEPDPVPELLEQLRATFSLSAVSVLSNRDDGWVVDASAGDDPPTEPFDGQRWPLTEDESSLLVVRAGKLSADDQRVLRTFLDNLELALQSRRLQAEATAAAHLAETDRLRTALLQAVSHDLRTPLASIKASSSSLVQDEVAWTTEERKEFARTIDSEVDRLTALVENLLDMSRVQAGAITPSVRPTYLDEVVAAAVSSLGQRNGTAGTHGEVVVSVPEDLPPVTVDPSLLERAIANVVANALAWSPDCAPVHVDAARIGDAVHLRVVDAGPGVRPEDRARVFRPFQRLGDRSSQGGVGLGLAVARGFVEANGGEIVLDDTPGGGLTVLIVLPLTPDRATLPA